MPDEIQSAAIKTRNVLVVYENASARELAVRFCEQLASQHSSEHTVKIGWCSFPSLCESNKVQETADTAVAADLIVFALLSEGDLPQEVKLWIERWLGKRSEREGAIVGLLANPPANRAEMASLKEVYLRQMAHQAGLDYLSHATPTFWKALPDSLDSFSKRAGEMSSVLDQILHANLPPTPLI